MTKLIAISPIGWSKIEEATPNEKRSSKSSWAEFIRAIVPIDVQARAALDSRYPIRISLSWRAPHSASTFVDGFVWVHWISPKSNRNQKKRVKAFVDGVDADRVREAARRLQWDFDRGGVALGPMAPLPPDDAHEGIEEDPSNRENTEP